MLRTAASTGNDALSNWIEVNKTIAAIDTLRMAGQQDMTHSVIGLR